MGILLAALALSQELKPITIQLKADPTGLSFEGSRKTGTMYMPSSIKLEETRDPEIRKVPAGSGKWLFGSLTIGNGANRRFLVGLLTTETSSSLHIDFNQNGDLSDDDKALWTRIEPKKAGDLPSYQGTNVFSASYKEKGKTWKSPYGLNFYWSPGRTQLNYYRANVLAGTTSINGQRVAVRLLENGNDGLYDGRFDTTADPLTLRPVTLVLNEFQRDTRGTFEFEGVNYLPTVRPDGTVVTLTPTFKVVKAPARPATRSKELLAPGTPAPDFTVEAYEGGPVRLSDFRGKIVVLKFWATWCGPCKVSMPHFEKLYQKTKPQGVELLAVCVSDERDAYKSWVKANRVNYSYPFFFDPAGRAENQSISGRLFNVSGIPTVFIIGKDGKVAESIVGYSEGDTRVDQALAKLGVNVK